MIVGLTGGIASGKTVVARIFEMLGAAVFYSDKVAKDLYSDPEIKAGVIKLLGPKAYTSSGVNKTYIRKVIFADEHLLGGINSIIHPAVGKKFGEYVIQNAGKLVLKESALLFEAGVAEQCDRVIVVAAPDELRLQRIIARDKTTLAQAQKKLNSQLPQEQKINKADYVIRNGEEELVIPQVLTIYDTLNSNA